MRYSALDCETPEGNIALLCTPMESYNIETWEDFTSKFMVKKNQKTVYFTWNLRFDSQAILKLLPYEKLIELWKAKSNRIEYEGYRITYIPKKMLVISIIEHKGGAIHLYDAAQYYSNKSLDSMAKEHLGECKMDTVSGEEIGKSHKYYDENYDEIVKYCKRDAELTLKLGLLAMKNVEELGFNPSNPISPASISRKYQRERGYPQRLDKMKGIELKANAIAMLAYKGGVFATYQRGYFRQPLFDYDVNSCYPAIMVDLPDWRNGRFEYIENKLPEDYEYGWILCDIDTEYIPYQDKEHYTVHEIYEDIGEWNMKYTAKKVTYPMGERTAVITTEEYRWLKKHNEKVKWLGEGIGWVKENDKYPNPFGWLKEMFDKRKGLKKINLAMAQTLKLLMNSLYGSTVQRKNGIGELSNFCYGSYITGRARTQMFDVKKENPNSICNIATDGLLCTRKLNLPLSKELGEWEYNEYTSGLVIGNGIRQLWKEDGNFETHARGITSDRTYNLLAALKEVKDKKELAVGRTRVIQLGTMVNAHIKWEHKHLNTFVFQSRVLKTDTDKKRTWDREYENFGDLLESEPMDSNPLVLGEDL